MTYEDGVRRDEDNARSERQTVAIMAAILAAHRPLYTPGGVASEARDIYTAVRRPHAAPRVPDQSEEVAG
jgi:hypothetical protein